MRIVKISAGSSSVGSHSAALDSQGQIYMWGVAYAIGMGTVKPVLEPTLLQTFHLDEEEKTHQRKWQRMQLRRQRKQQAKTQSTSNNPLHSSSSSSSRAGDTDPNDDEDDEDDDDEEEGMGRADAAYAQVPTDAPLGSDMGLFGSVPCIDVACGGGFTVVVTRYHTSYPLLLLSLPFYLLILLLSHYPPPPLLFFFPLVPSTFVPFSDSFPLTLPTPPPSL